MTAKQIEELVLKGTPLFVQFSFNISKPCTFQVGSHRITQKQYDAVKQKFKWDIEQLTRLHKYTIKTT